MAEDEKPETDETPTRGRRRKADAEICELCWPDGWPGNDSGATCEHGTYKR